MAARTRLPLPPSRLEKAWGEPPLRPLLPWVSPMKLRAKATPIAAAPPLAPPAPAAVIVSTLALIEEVSVALTVTVPFQVVPDAPRLALVTRAWLLPVIVLKLLAPPPARPAAKPLPTAAAMAVAIDLALIVPVLVEVTETVPVGRTEAKFASSALVLRRMVLVASEMPMDGAPAAPPLKLAAREAPTAVASMLAASEARIVRSELAKLLAGAPLPVMVAVVLVAMTLVASLPAPLRAADPEAVAAIAAETATTSALMVALWLASTRMAPLVRKVPSGLAVVPEMVAEMRLPSPLLATVGLPPERAGLPWVAPMKLRARATPMAAAPPLAPPAPAALIVSTLALIEEVSVALTVTVPFQAVEAEPRLAPVTRAWLSPVIVLKLLAPPPARPAEKPLPTATAIAAAIDLALIVPLFVEVIETLPVGRTEAKFASSALVLRRMVLVASEMPIDGAPAAPPLKLAAREAPTAVASMLATSEARIVRSVLLRLELLPEAELPAMVAVVLVAMTLVASLPAPLRATVPELAAATAAETATTSALMVAVLVASTRMAPVAVRVPRGLAVVPEMVAEMRLPSPLLAKVGLPPERAGLPWVAPMKLRAMLTPMLAAPALPPVPPLPAAETAMILALIVPGELARTLSLPALMIEGLAMEAVVSPRMVL